MLTRLQQWGVYDTLYVYPDLQVYRKGRFEGFVRQPAKTGPVYYSNTSPSYAQMKPVSGSASGDDGGGSAGIIAIIVLAALALVGGLVLGAAPAHRRRAGVSARLVTAKLLGSLATLVFVIVFNFFLFRMVETDPVANLFRGRNLSQEQRKELTKEFGLDGSKGHQFVAVHEADGDAQLRPLVHDQPAGRGRDPPQGRADDRAGGHLLSAVGGHRDAARHNRRVAKTHGLRLLDPGLHDGRRMPCPTSGSG